MNSSLNEVETEEDVVNNQEQIELLEKAFRENPNDTFVRMALRDALLEAGDIRYQLLDVPLPIPRPLLRFGRVRQGLSSSRSTEECREKSSSRSASGRAFSRSSNDKKKTSTSLSFRQKMHRILNKRPRTN